MEAADFSGYATKAGLKCSDGRTIERDAFKHQDKMTVPLVWQHGHSEPTNVLGHAILENREDGVYCHGYFNDTDQGKSAKKLVQHKDITALSIYANKLVERAKNVLHGSIREVSLVLSGANPGALIDNVSIAHSDSDEVEFLEDEAVIYTGLELQHSESQEDESSEDEDLNLQEVYDTFTPEQKEVVHYMLGEALTASNEEEDADELVEHAGGKVPPGLKPFTKKGAAPAASSDDKPGSEKTIQDVYNSMTDEQKQVVHYMIGAALEESAGDASHSDDTNNEGDLNHQEGTEMTNVFERNGSSVEEKATLSHDQLKTIVADAQKLGSFKESFMAHAGEYGIEDIDVLFPDAQSVTPTPELIARRMEWVADVINGTKHSPFSRIKSTAADLTADEARAKGYVKGAKKKDEIIKLLKRVTVPTTIYKKQKLDRDDIVDITDLDVVAWLKAEMRVMLDEELARAVLVGDGREPDDEDKIDEEKLRPVAYDDDMYAHKVTVPANVAGDEVIEAVLRARTYYKGTGTPTLYCTDAVLTDLMLLKDKVGRRLYETELALAAAMRVAKIVVVEVMDDHQDLLAIVVNLADYTMGADRGGAVSMFDDFDIDYNQYKYLIETRVSGALTKPKSAVIVNKVVGTAVVPSTPSYNATTHTIAVPTVTGVTYKIDGVTKTGNVVITETTEIEAFANTGYTFPHNTNTDWTYVYTA